MSEEANNNINSDQGETRKMLDNLNRYLDDYTDMLLEDLVVREVIKDVTLKGTTDGKKYQLADIFKDDKGTSSETLSKEKRVVQEFYDFRNIVNNVFQNIKSNDPEDGQATTLSRIVNRLVEYKAFNPDWRTVSILRDFLDKADDLLTDDELTSSTVTLLETYKVNFNSLILELLKFHAKHILSKNLNVETIEEVSKKEKSSADYLIRLKGISYMLLVEVKFRKKNIQIKELIQQCQELLRKYGERSNIKSHVLLVVYTYESASEIERSKFRFKQNIDGPFRDLDPYIHFMPIQIGTFTNLPMEIELLRNELKAERVFSFVLKNQPANSEHPDKDDHYYPQVFNLNKNGYDIRFWTKTPPEHWRFGVQFSMDGSFPARETRHLNTHPVFHLEKNKDAADHLHYSYYATDFEDLGKPSTLQNYHGEPLTIRVYTENGETIVETFDQENRTILQKPINVNGFKYFKVFAWADGRNPFEFHSEVIVRN
ncbi:MAG TPA: hypothetical protein PKC72_15965 [Chitinophagaceae bacterium]|nr:hypothetical protein [Chitinophagaceae bacterium]